MGGGTVRFNPRTETFTPWATGSNMFGIDPAGTVCCPQLRVRYP